MKEETHRIWDIIFKFFAGIGAIISFWYGVEKFEISSRRDFAKEFYKEEIIFYNELVSVTSSLANQENNDSIKKQLIKQFEMIYYGKKDYFIKDKLLLDYVRKFNDAVTFIKNNQMDFSENETSYERANKYAVFIGKQSRINIDKIIFQLKNSKDE
jgi:hypothetical protein